MDTGELRVRSSVGRRLRRPTSGFMLVVPVDRVKNVDMSVEDAMKLVISGGALKPGATVVGRKGLDLETLLRDTLG